MDTGRTHHNENPMPNANVFSKLFFCWLNPIFSKGYKKALNVEDMYNVRPDDDATFLTDQLERAWENQLKKSRSSNRKASLLLAIWETLRLKLLMCTIVVLVEEVIRVVQPILIGQLVLYFVQNSDVTLYHASMLALGVFLLSCFNTVIHHIYFFTIQVAGMRIRIAACGLLYRKALKLSTLALSKTTPGQVVNLMSNDVSKFDMAVMFLPYLIVAPLQAIAVLVVLWQFIGSSSLVGLIALLIFTPIQGLMGKVFSRLRLNTAKHTDERVHLMDELITGMKIIKMYCWEKPFSEMVSTYRSKELDKLWTTKKAALMTTVPAFVSRHIYITLTILASSLLAGVPLKSDFVYTLTAISSVMMWSMTGFFPMAIMLGSQGIASVARIQKFLELDESDAKPSLEPNGNCVHYVPVQKSSLESKDAAELETLITPNHQDEVTKTTQDSSHTNGVLLELQPLLDQNEVIVVNGGGTPANGIRHDFSEKYRAVDGQVSTGKHEAAVVVEDMSAKWPSQEEGRLALETINLSVRTGELVAVVGPVGAGKSSLLMTILHECPITAGSCVVHGTAAYVSQQAWIFSASLRQNILFGLEFDEVKYKKVLDLCALEKDISLLPYGDQSLVGERGVSLSGGQRARVSLARALYHEAQIYLLDDPLSAVDAAVGKHLFDKCIKEHLKDHAVVLVTHQLQYLEKASRILVLKDSKQLAVGTFQELSSSGIDFTELLKCYEEEDEKKSSGPAESSHAKIGTAVLPHILRQTVSVNERESSGTLEQPRQRRHTVNARPTPSFNEAFKSMSQMAIVHSPELKSAGSVHFLNAPTDVGLFLSMHSLHDEDIVSSDLNMGQLGNNGAQVQEEEHREEGNISASVYKEYVLAGANIFVLIITAMMLIAGQVCFVLVDWWISKWLNSEELYRTEHNQSAGNQSAGNQSAAATHLLSFESTSPSNLTTTDWTRPAHPSNSYLDQEGYIEMRNFHIYVLLGLVAALIITSIARVLLFYKVCIRASQRLHDRMFRAVVRSHMRFFDTNPIGRILNRFSKDIGLLDDWLPSTIYEFISCFLITLSIVTICVIINPYMLILTIPLMVGITFIRRYYVTTSRAVKRLEGTTNSPVYSHVSASLTGLYTIRAFRAQRIFMSEFASHQNLHTESCFLFLATSRWLAIRLEWLCVAFVGGVLVAGICARDNLGLSAGMVGLTITYSMYVMGLFQWMVRQSTEVENMMTAVERVLEYCNLPSEAPLETEVKPAANWPAQAAICIKDVSMRYSDSSPFVLKDISADIKPSEKVGIVGRTGAGKSSVLTMLFRICEPTGAITIDGLDIRTLGLHDLRRKISIIPQDPVLFSGTVRYNLDPFAQYLDQDIWDALRQVQLYPVISSLTGGIQAKVESGGSNFSVGQRQLLCLARAILGKNKILVIDEATANVDTRTDALIQQTIRENFKNCTVLTIAHRLHTIMDSDRVLVLDEGRVQEFAPPYTLMLNEQSLLYKLAVTTGPAELNQLKEIAKMAFREIPHKH